MFPFLFRVLCFFNDIFLRFFFILSSYYYYIPSHLLPTKINPDINQDNVSIPVPIPSPLNQQILPNTQVNKIHPSKDQESNTTQNLLDLFLRKHLSR